MNKKSSTSQYAAGKSVKQINRKARKHYSAEEQVEIVLSVLRGEENFAALCYLIQRKRLVLLGTRQRALCLSSYNDLIRDARNSTVSITSRAIPKNIRLGKMLSDKGIASIA